MESENKGNLKEKKKFSWRYFFNGEILTEKFVADQIKLLLLIFVLILIFISNRYSCSKKLTEMDKLKRELVELQYEQVILTSKLATLSRQSQIEELLREKKSGLSKNNAVIYEIRK